MNLISCYFFKAFLSDTLGFLEEVCCKGNLLESLNLFEKSEDFGV